MNIFTHDDIEQIEAAIKKLIDVCGDDSSREGVEDTPLRVFNSFLEQTQGYREDPSKHLEKTFDVEHRDLVVVKDIDFTSMCEHHLINFQGVAHIAYIPNKKVTGLSKFARVVEGYARRFQVQERLTNQIKDTIKEKLDTKDVIVILEAKHNCMCARGVQKQNSSTLTVSTSGAFDKTDKRNEFLQLIK
uniref:GTP cyclohydrolase I FolE n=1 Tax=uncultured Allobacillus sp. TaxID=1638025 RepID=UPI00259AB027|nr:GTP cyclohydrolase I FolE [uncultured Allobacillus sp.]